MRIILRQDVDNLGIMGEVVTVKDGYARNYLIPRQMAYYASPSAVDKIEKEKEVYMQKRVDQKIAAQSLADKFNELQVTIAMKVGDEGKLFGSVTTQMIADELKLQGFNIDKRDITIPDAIKTLGVFQVKVKLHAEVTANLRVWVISEE
ncbi:50S ribosomal protein L9 [Candidatus Kapabacteria bacterium]|nr:50S ribosomal protein L9 [Candidatus Kapabacteria bacterium]